MPIEMAPAMSSAIPPRMTSLDSPSEERPAVRAKGTVSPSERPMTLWEGVSVRGSQGDAAGDVVALECIRSAFRFVLAHAPFGIIACRGAWGNYSNVRREMIDPIGKLYGLDEGQSGQSKCALTWAEQRAGQPSVSNFSLAEKTFGISGRLQTRFRIHSNASNALASRGASSPRALVRTTH